MLEGLIDLHLHLDGSLSIENAASLARLQNMDVPSDEELKGLLSVDKTKCKNLVDYLAKFDYASSILQTKEALELATVNLTNELYASGLIYAEIRFAPQKHMEKGLSQEDAILAVLEGMKKSKLKCNIILCCMRGDTTEEENLKTIELAKKYQGKGVCAVDLAGAEALYDLDYSKLFDLANTLGVNITIHAGEALGADSVQKAIKYGAKRIGHGVRALEDMKVVEELKKNNIYLEICPTSNIDTNVFATYKDYPLRRLMDLGLKITINTDDMAVSDITLQGEYQKLIDSFGITKDEIKGFLCNSVECAFITDSEKKELKKRILDLY